MTPLFSGLFGGTAFVIKPLGPDGWLAFGLSTVDEVDAGLAVGAPNTDDDEDDEFSLSLVEVG